MNNRELVLRVFVVVFFAAVVWLSFLVGFTLSPPVHGKLSHRDADKVRDAIAAYDVAINFYIDRLPPVIKKEHARALISTLINGMKTRVSLMETGVTQRPLSSNDVSLLTAWVEMTLSETNNVH